MAIPDDQSKSEPPSAEPTAAGNTPPSEAAKPEPTSSIDELPKVEPRALILTEHAWSDASKTFDAGAATSEDKPRTRSLPLAASIALAIALGGIAGAAATASLMREPAPPPAALATADANRALRESQTRLESELAALKTAIASGQRSTTTQIGKLSERLDRTEKAQAEPAAKIAKVAESIDRLERRLPAPAAAPAAPTAGDITGSVATKTDAKPPIAEGWHLLDSYAGRAVVESRSGRVFEVGPGSNLPGLGRVEAVKRENGRTVVVTRNGIIAALPDARRTRFLYDD